MWTTRQEAFFSEDEEDDEDEEAVDEDFVEDDDFSVDVDVDLSEDEDLSEDDGEVAGVDAAAADLLSERLSVR